MVQEKHGGTEKPHHIKFIPLLSCNLAYSSRIFPSFTEWETFVLYDEDHLAITITMGAKIGDFKRFGTREKMNYNSRWHTDCSKKTFRIFQLKVLIIIY